MDARLNIFTQTRQVEFIPVSPCHSQFIGCHHNYLSLARPNDMKIITVQDFHGLRWNLQTFYSIGEDKVKCPLISSTIIRMRATQHFHRGLLLGKTQIKRKSKKISLLFFCLLGAFPCKQFFSFLFFPFVACLRKPKTPKIFQYVSLNFFSFLFELYRGEDHDENIEWLPYE